MRLRRGWLSVVMAVTVFGCRDTATETTPSVGRLVVAVSGLPTGVSASVVVTGPTSFRQTLDSSRTLVALTPGTYTVAPQNVTTGISRYTATPTTQTVAVSNELSVSATPISYALGSARLTLTVIGLPAGAASSITVTGPRNYTRTVTGASQLDLLEPGTYTLTANEVTVQSKVYRAVTTTQVIGLTPSNIPFTASVEYGAGNGELALAVSGIPFPVEASIDVAGPNGYARRLTASGTLGRLEAGSYTVTANDVGAALTTYRASLARQTIAITGNDARTARVAYDSVPLQLAIVPFVTGLVQPVYLTAPRGDARQFVVERGGRIKLVVGGAVQSTLFADLSARVNNSGERGMLSMAFDPAYATNGLLYVYYVGLNGNVIVERLTSVPGAAVATGSGGIVISIAHGGGEHHGGMIAFGPDGMLYLAPGDGGCCGDPQGNAQKLTTMLGKILRINVRAQPYTLPSDNPFLAQPSVLPEIWAYGLRNPWRFAFDATTSQMYIGDVGQDAREEINVVPAANGGMNFGWPFTEGTACYNPSTNCTAGRALTLPVVDYPHSEGCSVTGGFVYRGVAIPELSGHYLYADYCRGWLRSFRMNAGRVSEQKNWTNVSLPLVNSFGQDGAGELYMISGAGVWRIVRQ